MDAHSPQARMGALTPQAGSKGVNGRVTKIWWLRAYGRCFALSIKEGALNTTWWVLWSHAGCGWKYKVFWERDKECTVEWPEVYSAIHQVAVEADGFDLYLMQEEVEEQNMFVWIVYRNSEERFVDEVEVETLLVLATPVQHWEEHRAYPLLLMV
jgi:hypothetical protein